VRQWYEESRDTQGFLFIHRLLTCFSFCITGPHTCPAHQAAILAVVLPGCRPLSSLPCCITGRFTKPEHCAHTRPASRVYQGPFQQEYAGQPPQHIECRPTRTHSPSLAHALRIVSARICLVQVCGTHGCKYGPETMFRVLQRYG
jgi:hypothetical protein